MAKSKKILIGKCALPKCERKVYKKDHRRPVVHDNIYFGRQYFCSRECKEKWVYSLLDIELKPLERPLVLIPFKPKGCPKII